MEREADVIESVLESLNPTEENRLAELLFDRRVRSAVAEMRPCASELNASVTVVTARDGTARVRIGWRDTRAFGLERLQERLKDHLKQRVPELKRTEFENADTDRR